MKKNRFLDTALCSQFCSYYKPGKKEELACRGHEVVEQLLRQGRSISFYNSGKKPDRATAEALVKELCMTCPFFAQGCDFMQDRSAHPCGGFMLLSQLLESGAIMLADINT